MKHIHLHIDRLVLRGFRPEDRHGVADGLQDELQRMLADPRVARQLAQTNDVSRLKIGAVTVGHGAKPRQVGARVGRSIGGGIKK